LVDLLQNGNILCTELCFNGNDVELHAANNKLPLQRAAQSKAFGEEQCDCVRTGDEEAASDSETVLR
jgi:hypothetical protein